MTLSCPSSQRASQLRRRPKSSGLCSERTEDQPSQSVDKKLPKWAEIEIQRRLTDVSEARVTGLFVQVVVVVLVVCATGGDRYRIDEEFKENAAVLK